MSQDQIADQIRNGWGASAVDALSTALIMKLPEIVNQIVDYVPDIDWSVSANNEPVSLFETTIRYVAGLLSGYDLLNGPLSGLVDDVSCFPSHEEKHHETNELLFFQKTKVNALLQQATNLANNLSYAFDTPTGIPSNNLLFADRSTDGSSTNGLATVGTLVMEWTRLSDLTGNETYGALTQKAESYLLSPQPASSEPWPGLVGTNIDINTGEFQDASGGWNGGDDSFYEYLIKVRQKSPVFSDDRSN
jgi:mannosyl-oligosaccharide alpha-1,2-mannosidase